MPISQPHTTTTRRHVNTDFQQRRKTSDTFTKCLGAVFTASYSGPGHSTPDCYLIVYRWLVLGHGGERGGGWTPGLVHSFLAFAAQLGEPVLEWFRCEASSSILDDRFVDSTTPQREQANLQAEYIEYYKSRAVLRFIVTLRARCAASAMLHHFIISSLPSPHHHFTSATPPFQALNRNAKVHPAVDELLDLGKHLEVSFTYDRRPLGLRGQVLDVAAQVEIESKT